MKLPVACFIVYACVALVHSQQFNRRQDQCYTPENYYGTCVQLSYCPQIVNLYKRAPQYVFSLQRSCGTRNINGDPVVCCTRPQTIVQTTQRPKNPFFPTNSPFVQPTGQPTNPFFTTGPPPAPVTQPAATTATPIVKPQPQPTSVAPLIDNRSKACRDPNLRDGSCIALEQCKELVTELYAKQQDEVFANYLRASNRICGSVGSIVCCPSNDAGTVPTPPTKIINSNEIPKRLPAVNEGCGYTTTSFKKIVGGEASKRGAWPWIALIGYNDELSSSPFKCGGTLITARHVITAAHCILDTLSFVRLGEHDLTKTTEAETVDIPVVRKEKHPDYNKKNGRSDIALLYLERNVQFTDFISPVCMPITPDLRAKSYVRYTPFVVGWGKTMEGGISAQVLQELQITIYTNNECRVRYQKVNRLISENQFDSAVICAGVLTGGKDTCQGDSGGPLMIPEPYEDNVRYYLIGVVSYGVGCARPEIPGVYTSTQYFMDWITSKVADTS